MDGFLVIDKPAGITSAEVIRVMKRRLRAKKIGYLGTLDPIATGVLVVAMESATRLIPFMEKQDKEYNALMTLGAETDTQDSQGAVVGVKDASHITAEDVRNILPRFVGDVEQIPPMYSAKKQQGQRLYTLARQGIVVERKPLKVKVRSIELLEMNGPVARLLATVSTGVYLRTLCHDVGNALGVHGHLSGLVRTRSGIFGIKEAIGLDFIERESLDEVKKRLVSLAGGLGHLPWVKVVPHAIDRLKHGVPLGVSDTLEFGGPSGGEYISILTKDGELAAVGTCQGGPMAGFPFTSIRPKRVMV
jgi:tRNA pseudouridine55 synthase